MSSYVCVLTKSLRNIRITSIRSDLAQSSLHSSCPVGQFHCPSPEYRHLFFGEPIQKLFTVNSLRLTTAIELQSHDEDCTIVKATWIDRNTGLIQRAPHEEHVEDSASRSSNELVTQSTTLSAKRTPQAGDRSWSRPIDYHVCHVTALVLRPIPS